MPNTLMPTLLSANNKSYKDWITDRWPMLIFCYRCWQTSERGTNIDAIAACKCTPLLRLWIQLLFHSCKLIASTLIQNTCRIWSAIGIQKKHLEGRESWLHRNTVHQCLEEACFSSSKHAFLHGSTQENIFEKLSFWVCKTLFQERSEHRKINL